jgi:hypothetical protein
VPSEEQDINELGVSELLKGTTKPKPTKGGVYDPTKTNPTIVVTN